MGGGGGGAVGFHVVNRPTESTTHYSADISIHSSQEPCLGILEKKKKGDCTIRVATIVSTKYYIANERVCGMSDHQGKQL